MAYLFRCLPSKLSVNLVRAICNMSFYLSFASPVSTLSLPRKAQIYKTSIIKKKNHIQYYSEMITFIMLFWSLLTEMWNNPWSVLFLRPLWGLSFLNFLPCSTYCHQFFLAVCKLIVFFIHLLGDIQIGMMEKKGQLEVEVIRARGLVQKPGSKSLPGNHLTYV